MSKTGLMLIIAFVSIKHSVGQDSLTNEINNFLISLEKKQQSLIHNPFPPLIINGKSFNDAELKGKVTLINFWFASCKPCLLEFNALSDISQKLSAEKKFQLITFTYEKNDAIEDLKNKFNMWFNIMTIPEVDFRSLLQGFGCPVNVIVDEYGIVKFWKFGGEISEEKSDQFFRNEIYPRILKELSIVTP
ncbi:MAG: TlpA family protein disulfide reductase [Chitinophagaceae bacterium]|nr:TlpA family protein disulfide reductase [Chitinophagaceae bacterium]